MTVRFIPLNIVPAASFGGWNAAFVNSGISGVGINNYQAISDTLLNRYVGRAIGGVGNTLLQTSTKAAPGVWTSPGATPINASRILDIWALPGVVPDTLLIGTLIASNAKLWRYIQGTGFSDLAFPDAANSDSINCVGPTESDPDLFLVGNGAEAASGSAQLWMFRLSTVTWTKIGGTGLNGSWNYVNTNSGINNTVARNGFVWVTVGRGTVDGFQVWRTPNMGVSWTKIGGDGVFGSWPAAGKRSGYVVLMPNGKMYAGIGGTAGNAEVWECTNPGGGAPSWVKVGDPAVFVGATITNANQAAAAGNKIVFGLSGSAAGNSQVWQYDTLIGPASWTRLAIGTWSRTTTPAVYVSPYDKKLFVGVGDGTTGTAILYEVGALGSSVVGPGLFFPAPIKVRA